MKRPLFDGQVAPYYDSWFETGEGRRVDRLEKALLAGQAASFGVSGTLLEVGAGTGHFSYWLAEQGWQVTGLDLSAPMLAQARARGSIPLVQGDAVALPFPDRSFDVVAIITALEFVPSPLTALREAWRVARKGLLLGVLNRVSPIAWARRLQEYFRPGIYRSAHFFSPAELAGLARATAGQPIGLRWKTVLWPRFLPLEGGPLPWGAFIGMAAWRIDGNQRPG